MKLFKYIKKFFEDPKCYTCYNKVPMTYLHIGNLYYCNLKCVFSMRKLK